MSDVFSSMFEHDTTENFQRKVIVPEVTAKTMAEFLQYIYTGWSDPLETGDVSSAIPLFKVAHLYLVEDLKSACIAVMRSGVTEANALELFSIAQVYNQNEILEALMYFCFTYFHAY